MWSAPGWVTSAPCRGASRSPSTESAARPRARARSSRATAATRRASCSRPTTSSRSSSIWAPACAPTASPAEGEFHGTALLSHLHWDHMQGLPFFVPLHVEGATLDVYGPRQAEGAARRRVRADDAPALLPDPADRSGRRDPVPRHRRRRLPRRARQGPVAVGAPRRARRSGSASSGTAPRSPTCPTTGRELW